MPRFSNAMTALGLALCAACLPAVTAAEMPERDLTSEITGNWAGASGDGFSFRARIGPEADEARLTIWNGMGGVPAAGDTPDLNVGGFTLAAFATSQRLEVSEDQNGATLLVITEYADEESEGRETISVRFSDFRFVLAGYEHQSVWDGPNGESVASDCRVDTLAGTVVDNGASRALPPLSEDDLNASTWQVAAAYDRGWCSRDGEG